jgi:hypothetical protein
MDRPTTDFTLAPLRTDAPPCEREVKQVMQELGFDYLQARNHVRCREALRRMPDRSMAQPE